MRIRLGVAATAVALLPLSACSSGSDKPNPGALQNTAAAFQAIFLEALTAVEPGLAADPDAIAKGRSQCSVLNDGDPDGHAAAMRFSTSEHPLADEQGVAINKALQLTICPPKN
ncbi:hypothetical protein [Streptomyces sp. NBC_01198]|uniref:hypothetical protein n=1 Tax=Streptomyces sp. NBC_01198 TaxID=2903769 RepID=UPI002E11BD14|nr:hypothetical protein OG702_05150 [Streptomyces sp. NBC_01198]